MRIEPAKGMPVKRNVVNPRCSSQVVLAISLIVASPFVHAQDAAAGKQVAVPCLACHTIDGNGGEGPTLKGVIGRKVGSVEGFRYSRAMKSADYAWDAAKLDAYIADPQKVIPGNVMPFSGIPDAKQRADLVAYLATLK
jgi:cytochrome c